MSVANQQMSLHVNERGGWSKDKRGEREKGEKVGVRWGVGVDQTLCIIINIHVSYTKCILQKP